MAFGQHTGPPASSRQVEELLSLLRAAGHTDFRDARGPLGFTQRQAAGRFTREEADAFLARLRDDGERDAEGDGDQDGVGGVAGVVHPAVRLSSAEQALRRMPAARLAAELQRRGWVVMEP
jgi:hypothetical protein